MTSQMVLCIKNICHVKLIGTIRAHESQNITDSDTGSENNQQLIVCQCLCFIVDLFFLVDIKTSAQQLEAAVNKTSIIKQFDFGVPHCDLVGFEKVPR